MAKRNCDKEYGRVQELSHENKKLRKENAALKKQLARLDIDRLDYVKDIVNEHLADEESERNKAKLAKSFKNRPCYKCQVGEMEIVLYQKMGKPHYFRECSHCTNRTRGQPYHDGVEGAFKPVSEAPIKLGTKSKRR